MANKKLSDGVGKKIVEALKKQSEIEITPISAEQAEADEFSGAFGAEEQIIEETFQDDFQQGDLLGSLPSDDFINDVPSPDAEGFGEGTANIFEETPVQQTQQSFVSQAQPSYSAGDSFIKELDTFEIPSNIAVLKKLIAQLPSGVTRQTGAQIIKQTMEALGISMKSVLQEAQQVQDGLSNSARECHATVQEYKKQILLLEKQSQNYQRQYSALNELISLFIQTGV